jgi:hypothetical protein
LKAVAITAVVLLGAIAGDTTAMFELRWVCRKGSKVTLYTSL